MSYFNHAFQKTFVGTDGFVSLNGGKLGTPGNILSGGQFAFVDAKTWNVYATDAEPGCCNLILAAGSIYQNDKIGPFHGGYLESNKSKEINPRYVSRFYRVDPCAPSANVIHVGKTPYTDDRALSLAITNDGASIQNGVYTDIELFDLTSATGSGLTVTITVINGEVSFVEITDGGTGYVTGDVVQPATGISTAGSSIAGTTMTIAAMAANGGFFEVGMTIQGTGVTAGTTIISQLSGTPGGAGTYEVSDSQTVAGPIAITGFRLPWDGDTTIVSPTFTVTAGVGANCCKEFLCGETYSLRLDVKGSPALRFLNHNAYLTVSAYTGCCPEGSIAPVAVDSTEVMIKWAQQIVESPLINPFILPVVIDEAQVAWYAPGTDPSFLAAYSVDTWDHYVSPGHVDGACAGLVLNGSYVDTKFGDCTFQITDFYEKEPVRLYASETDLNGDPCTFDGICVITECQGSQAMGLGESVARDVILSESYRQNFFATDLRIREITQGNRVFTYIDRDLLYTRYYLQHNVPRFNNPSSTFDNDQYLLEVITDGSIAAFEDFVEGWLTNCSECSELEIVSCETSCISVVPNVNTWD
jgi:hypothetical protein